MTATAASARRVSCQLANAGMSATWSTAASAVTTHSATCICPVSTATDESNLFTGHSKRLSSGWSDGAIRRAVHR
jgi:hypothetical protein